MSSAPPTEELVFREGEAREVRDAFALAERALEHTASRMGVSPGGRSPDDAAIEEEWGRHGALYEFLAAQDHGSFWVCEGPEGMVGFARVVRFEGMEQLAQVMVEPALHGQGIGRALVERCWPEPPTPELSRIVVAAGSSVDLSLYTEFAVMPITGHWHLVQRTDAYLEQHRAERDVADPGVHLLEPEHAVVEWKRLEPLAIGHARPLLHDFFGRERTCLASLDGDSGEATSLCWIHPEGDIGPGVGAAPEDLVPVVLAALDRVAMSREPEELHVFCTTDSWWLLRRLRNLGFRVTWPSWVLCSQPLPGLDRYVPMRPPVLL